MKGEICLSHKSITLSLSILLLTLLSIFFIFQNYIFDRGNRVEKTLDNLAQSIKQGDWSSAEKSFNDFYIIWSKGKYLVSINNAEQDFSEIRNAVGKLKGAIEVKDQSSALQISKEIHDNWKNFKKIIPEP
jgi:hypothetical protein